MSDYAAALLCFEGKLSLNYMTRSNSFSDSEPSDVLVTVEVQFRFLVSSVLFSRLLVNSFSR